MDIEKLIRRLRNDADAYRNGETLGRAFADQEDVLDNAATALSTLQAENKHLNKIVCSIPTTPDSGRTVSQYDKEMSMCAYLDDLEAENEKLRAELERVKEERDAVVESIPHECKTCVYHTVFFNGCTLDHDCTNPDGGCSNNYDRWQWRGQHKED